ncbi:MAG: hypothetical protein KJO27_09050, partial [Gammaproteobacteria bacterium]|nr:hypothetical protein [Gammaproteobacteria bacterium]
ETTIAHQNRKRRLIFLKKSAISLLFIRIWLYRIAFPMRLSVNILLPRRATLRVSGGFGYRSYQASQAK